MNEDRYKHEPAPGRQHHRVTLVGVTEDGWRVSRTHGHHGTTDDLAAVLVDAAAELKSMPVAKGKLRSFRVEVRAD
jgi:hypothetical protein